MQNNLGKSVKRVREQRGWSQAQLAERSGITQGAISHIENSTSGSTRHLAQIAKTLGVTTELLTEGIETNLSSQPSLGDYVIIGGEQSGETPSPSEYVFIAPYIVRGSSETGAMGDISVSSGLVFKKEWLNNLGANEKDLAVVSISTDGMSPTIMKQQTLLINKAQTTPESSKIYVIEMGQKLYVKRLIDMLDHWILRSDNPDKTSYPDIQISNEAMKDIQIEGRLVWQAGLL